MKDKQVGKYKAIFCLLILKENGEKPTRCEIN